MASAGARRLRKSMTRQEVKLWLRLRELRAIGHHFRRQSPLSPYVVDFECRRSQLIVEVDGNQHGYNAYRQRTKRATRRWLSEATESFVSRMAKWIERSMVCWKASDWR